MSGRSDELADRYRDELARHHGYQDFDAIDDRQLMERIKDLVERLDKVLVDEQGIAELMGVSVETARVFRTRRKDLFPDVAQTGKHWFRDEVVTALENRPPPGRRPDK